jgi:hypothetical protein
MANSRSIIRGWIVVFLALLSLAMGPRLLASVPRGNQEGQKIHVVSRGESLWKLAEEYAHGEDPRSYVHKVQQLNRLSTVQLFPGQTLVLPSGG